MLEVDPMFSGKSHICIIQQSDCEKWYTITQIHKISHKLEQNFGNYKYENVNVGNL